MRDMRSRTSRTRRKEMKGLIVAVSLIVIGASGALAAECMVFPASMGKVSFPHKEHQTMLKDCKICHEKGPGKIEGFGKDVAHKLCVGCHKTKQAGPTKCTECHKK
jgi:predicted CXXCH cytochrome family protein